MKKSFTLLELVISITIFMILLIFLYEVLDNTKLTNKKFITSIEKKEKINEIYKIFIEDIAEARDFLISKDSEENSILVFRSSNTYNNPRYTNITYMISSNDKLIRIESKKKFILEKISNSFFEEAFVDTLLEEIEAFEVLKKDEGFVFLIKQKNKTRAIFSTLLLTKD